MFNILIVDDEKIVVSGIKKCLLSYRYPLKIFEAYDGEEAKQILENNQIHILLTDIEMPLINGLELIEIAKEIHPEIKTIVFSAYSNFEYARKAISLRAVYYLLKPINVSELQKVMKNVLDKCNINQVNKEEELLFLDIFKNEVSDCELINSISFFNRSAEDIAFSMAYLRFDYDILENMEKEFRQFVEKNVKVSHYTFKLDERQCVVAFKYYAYERFSVHDFYQKLEEWIDKVNSGKHIFCISSERVTNTALICIELEKIKHLKELMFYFTEQNVFLDTDTEGPKYTPTIDVQNILSAITYDVQEKNYYSVKVNIEKLLELLKINKQMSPMYVKYIFFDIIKQLQQNEKEIPADKLNGVLEKISNISKIEEVEEIIQPVIIYLMDLNENQNSHNHKIVEQIVDYIHYNYQKDISLEMLAEMVFLSPAYTSTIFKQVTNTTLTGYINAYRMKMAKKLLVETNMKLVDIFPLVGYSSLTYFCALFKNMFGETPSQYRKKKRKGEEIL